MRMYIKNLIAGKQDGTYSIKTGKAISFTKGYQVSFETTETYKLTNNEYNQIIKRLEKLLNTSACVGVYCGSVEISFHTDSKKIALLIAREFNQYSIWHWEKMQEIKNKHWKQAKNNIH